MAAMMPLADTQRVVGWEELPASVREIADDFDPTAAGVLMKHQVRWISLKASIKACPKGRRTGITFCEALDDTIVAGSRKDAGGSDVFYIGDTKEKGLEFVGYCAKFARIMASAQGQGVSGIEEFLFIDQDDQGNTKHINAYRIRFASGYRVVALSSRPANIRGLQGIVVIDEAAFHADVQAVLDAATALLIWGGEIHVISSYNGKRNAFYAFVQDIQAGRYGEDAKVLTITFDDAVGNGLYERVCWKKGEKPTPRGKEIWYQKIRNAYGPRKSAMREELDAIPRDGGGKSLPGVWIERSMREVRPVLRLVLDDDFVRKTPLEREIWAEVWIATTLKPLLDKLDRNLRHVAGSDYARHRDFSVLVPASIEHDLRRRVPFVIEMNNVPTKQQEQIVFALLRGLPNFSGAAFDATGSGQTIAEYTANEFGALLIHQVTLNRGWYGDNMPKLIDAYGDDTIDNPRDDVLADDLRAVEEIDGIPMVAALRTKDLKDPNLVRHGDFAVAQCLMWFASLNLAAPIEMQSIGRRETVGESLRRSSAGFGSLGRRQDYRGY